MSRKKMIIIIILVGLLLAVGLAGYLYYRSPAAFGTSVSSPSIPENPPAELALLPEYEGSPWVEINGCVPFFENVNPESSFAVYSPLDKMGRCGAAYANLGPETLPTEPRGEIGMIKPSGWHTVRYDDIIEGKYLYNRCHLIAFSLAGENANERNLITGTRSFNVNGMLPWENLVLSFIRETGNHVLYRVTPVFEGKNPVASGVILEAWSVEDGGEDLCVCVFIFNVQPGITIDYRTGESRRQE